MLDRTKKSLANLQACYMEMASANQSISSPLTLRNRKMNFPPPPLDSNSHLRPIDQALEQRKSRDQPLSVSSLHMPDTHASKNHMSNDIERIPTAMGRPTTTNGIVLIFFKNDFSTYTWYSLLNYLGIKEIKKEIKRQQVDLQKVMAADNKANELAAVERAKMERMITEARRQAAEEALVSINRQENNEEVCLRIFEILKIVEFVFLTLTLSFFFKHFDNRTAGIVVEKQVKLVVAAILLGIVELSVSTKIGKITIGFVELLGI